MKKVAGSQSLSQSKADRFAHLYALVVVQHRDKSGSEIYESLQVLLSHTKGKQYHCPPGDSSWSYFQKRMSQYMIDGGPTPSTRELYLTQGWFARAVVVFKVFESLSFCSTITLGKTQKCNESLHNMLCHNSPKSKHVGEKSLAASTGLAVLSFNDGSLSLESNRGVGAYDQSSHSDESFQTRPYSETGEGTSLQRDPQAAATTNGCTDSGSSNLEA